VGYKGAGISPPDRKIFGTYSNGLVLELLTPEVSKKICNLVRVGNYLDTAAAACGVTRATLHRWLRIGNKDLEMGRKTVHSRFVNRVHRVMAESELLSLAMLNDHGLKSWQAVAWKMERRFPERWGKSYKAEIELTGKDGGPIEIGDARKQLLGRLFADEPSLGETENSEDE